MENEKKNTSWIRQGDVIIDIVEDVKVPLKKVDQAILAEGEVTGHFHKLSGELMFAQDGDLKYLNVLQDSLLSHNEHDTLTIPKGKYLVRMQREVDLLGEVRQVLD